MSAKAPKNRIKAVLAETSTTNAQLAKGIGVSPETVSRWCTNSSQPSLKHLYKIAYFLNVDVRLLLVSNKKVA